ncbi:lipid IV(A) 4-amino-4-deoxy-L-arabinosyltransferase [Enterobacterales bacterium CwR94]|nr:lipid IV(A) 4-amino-4-deoxy-L-arabinosyltransferase [Enterobacterales bacterium CwR94]
MNTQRTALLIAALYVLYYLLPLEFRLQWQPDETRYAEISREMLASGNWIVPHFFDIRYFEKPVAGYWINNLSQLIFGHNNFAVRFGVVFSTTLSALIVYVLTLRMWSSKRTALLASVIFLTSLLVYGVGTYAVLDPMISLWLVLVMALGWQAFQVPTRTAKIGLWLLVGLACGMGFMTKGFLALAVPVIAVLPWAILQGRMRELLCYGPLAIVGAVAISAPWAIAIAQREPDFWHYFFWVEHIQRFAQDDAQHKAPFWYYVPIVMAGSLPWLGLLPGALRMGWQQRKQESSVLWLLLWVVMPILFFSIAKGKLLTYILPCFAPLAMLLARYAEQAVTAGGKALRINGWINLIFGSVTVLAALVVFAPWGLASRPVWQPTEMLGFMAAVLIFAWWAAVGFWTLRDPRKCWYWAALCPLMLALAVGQAIPEQVRDSKQPQYVVRSELPALQESRYVLANHPGIAAALAWELQRSDILLFKDKGELTWGLNFADAEGRYISEQDFPAWLLQHRREGAVSLLLRLSADERDLLETLPTPDNIRHQGRMTLIEYRPLP